MEEIQLADLELETIISLTGMPVQKDIVNPKNTKEMAKRVRVTLRPLPGLYLNQPIVKFRKTLEEKLKSNGVQVVPWEEATDISSDSLISKILRTRKVKTSIHAVIDVKREYSPIRKLMSKLAEKMYLKLRSQDMSVTEILRRSGWADDFTVRHLQDPYNTQVITLIPLNPEFVDENTPYDRKIAIGMQDLISTMSEIVIGVSTDRFSILNMNLSDSSFSYDHLDTFVLNSLIPKVYAPIKPPVLNRFEKGEYDPSQSPYAEQLANLGKELRSTDLFPGGARFSENIIRLSHKDIVEKVLEGRTGVSYGFIAIAEAPGYEGPREIPRGEWETLNPINGFKDIKQSKNDRWYVRTVIRDKETFQQVPDIWVLTSRSGCDKTNLDPENDVIRIGLVKGKLYLQTPEGVDFQRRDIRPSFDTYVILAQALSTALYTPELVKEGISIVHFHGYPDPGWFRQSEYHVGEQNPSMPCGTIEAALLNYSGIYEVANQNGSNLNLLCLVESDHGVNIMGSSREYLVKRITEGKKQSRILLGGKYLSHLKKINPTERNAGLS